jgi:pilus assembly protein CpaB
MVLSVVIAMAVFVVLTNYVRGVSSQVGPLSTVWTASEPIEAFTPLSEANLEPVQVPERWTAPTARLELPELDGRRVGFRMEPGTTVTSDMLIPPSDLSSTEREVAINVDPVTGVAGRVRPGDRVDMYSVFADVPGLPAQVRVLVRDVRVVSIGGRQTVTQTTDEGIEQNDVVPVTLALEPVDSLAVTYANQFAEEVRLVALPTDIGADRSVDADSFDAGDLGGTPVPVEAPGVPSDALPPGVLAPPAAAGAGATAAVP